MSVEINNIKDIDGTKNWIYLTLTVDGDTCKYVSVNPWNTPTDPLTGQALQDWCDNREDTYNIEILKGMYPNARYQDSEGDTELEKFTQWITDGHTNSAYCKSGSPYCTIASAEAYCDGAEGNDQATCELNEGIWVPAVTSPATQEACETADGTWVTTFDTAEKCGLASSQWIAEEVITKVPFEGSHTYTGDMRTRKLEELNTDLQTYLYTKYDVGTQISFQAIETRVDTPEVVKTALGTLFTWISGVMNYYYARKIAIRDGEGWQEETWDYTTFDATDPEISLEALMGPQ